MARSHARGTGGDRPHKAALPCTPLCCQPPAPRRLWLLSLHTRVAAPQTPSPGCPALTSRSRQPWCLVPCPLGSRVGTTSGLTCAPHSPADSGGVWGWLWLLVCRTHLGGCQSPKEDAFSSWGEGCWHLGTGGASQPGSGSGCGAGLPSWPVFPELVSSRVWCSETSSRLGWRRNSRRAPKLRSGLDHRVAPHRPTPTRGLTCHSSCSPPAVWGASQRCDQTH